MENLEVIKQSEVQFIWQTGKIYINEAHAAYVKAGSPTMIHVTDFISDMATAYQAADLIISRAGAGSISEFCLLAKPVILVPSPNVAEDHQTHNAMALVRKDAGMIIKDTEAPEKLLKTACDLLADPEKVASLEKNIAKLALTDAAMTIAKEVYIAIDK
jgi:UDP-N-acetylglucosamine--N-acetylmuramyl-(pentapeptide) pyrophosphoryl-undecaprenol N-acetylglucosamine transferase